MKIISWNINSIRVRIEHFITVINKYNPDVFLLQETKVEDALFPFHFMDDLGYNIKVYGQKARNGVAVFSKHSLEDVKTDFCEEARYIEVFTGGAYIASVYVPNGQYIDSEQYVYKLHFLNELKERFLSFKDEIFIAGGDFNVAPYENDVYEPQANGLLCSAKERLAIQKIRESGFKDILEEKGYTWWDYRHIAFKKNHGLRIDQFYLSKKAQQLYLNGEVLKEIRALPRPSDHAPILCEIAL